MKISDIKIGTRHRKSLGDIEGLANSIRTSGLLQAVVVNSANELIAGERRIEAAKRLGWTEIEAKVATHLNDIQKMLEAERAENTDRENFTPSEAVAMREALAPFVKAAAKARRDAGKNQYSEPSGQMPEPSKGESEDILAEGTGYSRHSLARAKAVVDAATEYPEHYGDIAEKMDETGKIVPAYRAVAERSKEPGMPKVHLPETIPAKKPRTPKTSPTSRGSSSEGNAMMEIINSMIEQSKALKGLKPKKDSTVKVTEALRRLVNKLNSVIDRIESEASYV